MKTLIVGMGPAGLELAIKLVERNYPILLIDKRDNPFQRDQRILLDEDYIRMLLIRVAGFHDLSAMSYHVSNSGRRFKFSNLNPDLMPASDFAFFSSVQAHDGVVKISELQMFLFNKLMEKARQKALELETSIANEVEKLSSIRKLTDLQPSALSSEVLSRLHDNFKNLDLYNKADDIWTQINEVVRFTAYGDENINSILDIWSKYKFKIFDIVSKLFFLRLGSSSLEEFTKEMEAIQQLTTTLSELEETRSFCNKNLHIEMDAFCINIDHLLQSAIESIISEKTQVIYTGLTIKQGTSLEQATAEDTFNSIVYMAGAKREEMHVLETISGIKIDIHDLPLPKSLSVEACGVVKIKLKESEANIQLNTRQVFIKSPIFIDSYNLRPKHLPVLRKHGWNQDFLPVIYIQFDPENKAFYITGQFPKSIHENNDPNTRYHLARAFALDILRIEYPEFKTEFDTDKFELDGDANLFQLSLSHVSIESARQLSSDGNRPNIFFAGDALATANFFFGHGILQAAEDANRVDMCLTTIETLTANSFNNLVPTFMQFRLDSYPDLNKNFDDLVWYLNHPLLFRGVITLESCKDNLTWAFNTCRKKCMSNNNQNMEHADEYPVVSSDQIATLERHTLGII